MSNDKDKVIDPAPVITLRTDDDPEGYKPPNVTTGGVLLVFRSGFHLRDEDLDLFFEAGCEEVEFKVDGHTYRFKANPDRYPVLRGYDDRTPDSPQGQHDSRFSE